jgi:hypothetical protein
MAKKKPEVRVVPDAKTFANHLVHLFMEESGMAIEPQEDESPLETICSVPDIHADFTLWLCELARENAYGDLHSPSGAMLN